MDDRILKFGRNENKVVTRLEIDDGRAVGVLFQRVKQK